MQQNSENDVYLTASQAAKLLPATSAATLRRWARNGDVPVTRLPSKQMRFRLGDIKNLLAAMKGESASMPSTDSASGVEVEGPETLPGLEGLS